MIGSLRTRFISGVLISLALLLCIAGLIIYSATKFVLIQNFDKSLLNTAEILSAVVESEGYNFKAESKSKNGSQSDSEEIEFEIDVTAMPEFNEPFAGAYYQFRDSAGNSIIRSPSLKDQDLPILKTMGLKPQFAEMILPDGKKGRAISFIFSPQNEGSKKIDLSLIVARHTDRILDHLQFLKRLIVLTAGAVIVISVLAGIFITAVGLKPIHFLAEDISAVDINSPDKTSISKNYPIELLPIVDCLNSLLNKLRVSFQREKQFNSDIAHELRTPLAGIKTTIEVSLSKNRQADEYKTALADCLEVTNGMNRMVDLLLLLARSESRPELKCQEIEVKNLIDECWILLADRAQDKNISFQNEIAEDLKCFSDRSRLSMVITNILDNAVEHCDSGGRIWTEGRKHEDRTIFSFSNTGCMLDDEQIEKVFDPFWTGDNSRKDTGRHCGIGLAIVKKITDILGAKIEAGAGPGKTFTITITLR